MNRLCFLMVLAVLGGCSSGEPTESGEPSIRFVVLDSCLRDAQTGLVWELKSDQEGLRDWRNTYSWFNPTQAHHELDYRGTADTGSCAGSQCDTWSIVAAANDQMLCGFDDWRMPSKDEIFSISDLSKAKSPPTIDVEYFPYTQAAEYWTANDYSFQPDAAWAWNFQFGHDRVDWKKEAKFVRLVRGTAGELEAVKE